MTERCQRKVNLGISLTLTDLIKRGNAKTGKWSMKVQHRIRADLAKNAQMHRIVFDSCISIDVQL